MKLKYYMRGLGIGMILTTLIFIITQSEEKLTDQQIISRARDLGMVTEEERNANLEKVLEESKPTQALEQPSGTPATNPTLTPTESPSIEVTITPTPGPTPEPTLQPTTKPELTTKPEPTKKPKPTTKPKPTSKPKEISFSIEKGMTSGDVAELLLEVGLIDDAADFNKYIVDSGKASIIRIGTYSLPQKASYKDIVKIITTK